MYLTIESPSQGRLTEKMSRFLAFAHPAASADEARAVVADYQRRYHDARHVCWAWVLGPDRADQYANDNGEPSGTAGRPILGQINSMGLTDTVVVVVRYFGGIKLGTPGLIAAYRQAARLALDEATVVERHEQSTVEFHFPYQSMNAVMAVAKMPDVEVVEREFDNSCRMLLSTRTDRLGELLGRLAKVDGLTMAE